jgi:hypothetical protein
LRSLVEYVALHKDAQNSENEWLAMNDDNNYWFKASEFIKQTCGTVRGSKYLYIFVCIHSEHILVPEVYINKVNNSFSNVTTNTVNNKILIKYYT